MRVTASVGSISKAAGPTAKKSTTATPVKPAIKAGPVKKASAVTTDTTSPAATPVKRVPRKLNAAGTPTSNVTRTTTTPVAAKKLDSTPAVKKTPVTAGKTNVSSVSKPARTRTPLGTIKPLPARQKSAAETPVSKPTSTVKKTTTTTTTTSTPVKSTSTPAKATSVKAPGSTGNKTATVKKTPVKVNPDGTYPTPLSIIQAYPPPGHQQRAPGAVGKAINTATGTLNKTVGTTTGTLNTITDSATAGVNRTVDGVTGVAGKGLDKLPAGVGKPVKHVTDGVGKTATGAVDNAYYTVGSATKGVQGTVSKTTGALGRGDVKGTVAGATSGVGMFVAFSFSFFFLSPSLYLPPPFFVHISSFFLVWIIG